MEQKLAILIDANSLIHRCFHALPPFTGPGGVPTGALYGVSNILLKVLREQKPDYIAAFFDRPEPTLRKEQFNEYKIHRPKAPDELISQLIEAHNLFTAFGVKTYEAPGYEADDMIGVGAKQLKLTKDMKVKILTSDSDILQVVEDQKIVVETPQKGISEMKIYGSEEVKEKYEGLAPNQIPDYKGLVGDSSDNIPGVSGIGPKTAIPLILKYGNLENFLEKGVDEKVYQKIYGQKEQALLSKSLATINYEAPLEIENVEEIKFGNLPKESVLAYFEKFGFKSLIKRISKNGNLGF
ncbi:MAG: 5'-3' exonuclease H3TH domain-containing protein [Candidatus Paceibacterota bacterium]